MNTLYDSRYYRVTKLFCSLVYLWPYQSKRKRRIMQLLQISMVYFMSTGQMNKLYQVWGKDIDAMCMCIPPLLSLVLYTFNNVTIIWFKSQIKILLHQIETKWEMDPGLREYEILTKYTSKSRNFCIIYSTIIYCALLCFIVMPTTSPILDIILPLNETRVRTLAFDLDYGIDQQDYWFWLWLYTSTSTIIAICNLVGATLLYIMFTIHGSCLFAIARYKSEHIADSIKKNAAQFLISSDYDTACNVCCHNEYKLLKLKKQVTAIREFVRSHREAIRYTQILHCIYKWNILVTTSVNLIIISVLAIQLVSKLFNWSEMVLSFMYITGVLFHLFLLTLLAQNILDESANVHESAYLSSWYNLSTKLWKDITFILMRSRTPCKLTAGKLFVMSLESFCKILQTSMSYFTLLASFR